MKILIAYDGSACSDAAILDLRRAGLPAVAEVMVLSMAELPAQVMAAPYDVAVTRPGMFLADDPESHASIEHQLQEARMFATQAAERLQADFPGWKINAESCADGGGAAILREARAWGPDLIVVGSHGRFGIRCLLLGSVSQRVLNHVSCSVRIGRHRLNAPERPIRLLVGVDGSNHAKAALQAITARNWPAGTEARAVAVVDSRVAVAAATTLEGTIPVAIEDECRCRLSRAVHEAAQFLEKRGLAATHQVLSGHPAEVLLAEAENGAADCVFVGARGLNALQRFLLGSVSTAVATRAHCSVEVVRGSAPSVR